MKRLTAIVYGDVQGVSFRAYTQHEATQLHISGWVANQWDGSVKVTAEGSDEALAHFVNWLYHGSPSARVERVETSWSPATGEFKGFRIRN